MQKQLTVLNQDPELLRVHTPQDIEFLVKESEVLTGIAGRLFVIAGADRLAYRVFWYPMGLKVERLDQGRVPVTAEQLPPWELQDHHLVDALRARQLFTPSVALPD